MNNAIIEAETAKLAGLQIDFLQKLRNNKISLKEFEQFLNLSQSERQTMFGTDSSVNSILRLLTTGDKPVIKGTTGQRFLAKAQNTFMSWINLDFKIWKLDKFSYSTDETICDVYELTADATFTQIFSSLSDDLDKLCLTQDQIEEFCLENRSWLRKNGYSTFFLFKESEHYFVASVRVYDGGLGVDVYRLGNDSVWLGEPRPRLVVPQ